MGSLVPQELVDGLYEAVVRIHTNTTHTEEEEEEAEDRILDAGTLTNLVTSLDLAATFSTLSGLFSFITSNLDVVTALSLVKYLENRAMYDPRSGHMIVTSNYIHIYCHINRDFLQVQRKLPGFLGEPLATVRL